MGGCGRVLLTQASPRPSPRPSVLSQEAGFAARKPELALLSLASAAPTAGPGCVGGGWASRGRGLPLLNGEKAARRPDEHELADAEASPTPV